MAQLGGAALGNSQIFVEAGKLKPYPTDMSKANDHITAAIDEAGKEGGVDAAETLTAYSRALDKSLLFLDPTPSRKANSLLG